MTPLSEIELHEFLCEKLADGVTLSVADEKLRFRTSDKPLDPAAISALKENKAAVMAWVERRQKENERLLLSDGQHALWFIDRLVPGNAAYNLSIELEVNAGIALQSVSSAIALIDERHTTLRTVIRVDDDGIPYQHVLPANPVPIDEIDARNIDDSALTRKLNEFADQPFDLENGPMMRAAWVPRSGMPALLVLTVHHIATDLSSMKVVIAELNEILCAEIENRIPILSDITVQYDDFVRWQQAYLSSKSANEAMIFWQDRFANRFPILDLPTDNNRPAVQTFRGETKRFAFDKAVTARIRKQAARHGVTPYVFVLAVWQVLLSRYSGQAEFMVGSPTSGRTHRAFEQIVGLFASPVTLRVDLTDDPTFGDFLVRVRDEVVSAMPYQFPHAALVERLNPTRENGRPALFQVEFMWERLEKSASSDLVQIVHAEQRGASFDISLMMHDFGETIAGAWRFNTGLFATEGIARMDENFETALHDALANPDTHVSRLRILAQSQADQIIAWNETSRRYPDDLLLHSMFEKIAEESPDRVAIVSSEGETSYGQLNDRANRLACYLIDLGVSAETLVGVHMERSSDLVVALYAILKAGGAYVPIDPELPPARKSFLLSDTAVSIVLTQSHLESTIPAGNAQAIAVDKLSDSLLSYDGSAPAIPVSRHNLAYVIYTSGSTGQPKGVMNTHAAVVNRILWMQDAFQLDESDCVAQKTPYSFDVSVWEFFWPLQVGARLAVAPPGIHKDPRALAEFVCSSNVTVIHFVPPMLRAFVPEVRNCTSLALVICSGESLPRDLVDAFHAESHAEIHNLYGPTEAAIDVTHWHCQRGAERDVIPIGTPIANTQIHVLDRHGTQVPCMVTGEIHIGGVQVARGYLNREELTQERFIPDPNDEEARQYRTGDLGRIANDGAIEFLGRNDFQIKVRGFRIELGEIESVLLSHEAVRDAVVVAREERNNDKRLVAYLVTGDEIDPSDMRQWLETRLPAYMIPAHFVELDAFPLSANGKIDRKSLPAPESSTETEFLAASSEIETIIAEIWADTLGVERVGVNDNFFDLGGHSLLLAQVQAKLRDRFSNELSYVDLFRNPTVGTLARHLGERETPAESAADRARDRVRRQRERLSQQRNQSAERRGSRGG